MGKYKLFQLGVKALIFNQDQKILLLKRPNKNVPEGYYWDFPGGLIEEDEDIEEALKREVGEETGVDDLEIKQFFYAVVTDSRINLKGANRILFVYLCSTNFRDIILSSEHVDFGWFDKKKASELVLTRYSDDFSNKMRVYHCQEANTVAVKADVEKALSV